MVCSQKKRSCSKVDLKWNPAVHTFLAICLFDGSPVCSPCIKRCSTWAFQNSPFGGKSREFCLSKALLFLFDWIGFDLIGFDLFDVSLTCWYQNLFYLKPSSPKVPFTNTTLSIETDYMIVDLKWNPAVPTFMHSNTRLNYLRFSLSDIFPSSRLLPKYLLQAPHCPKKPTAW